MALKRIELNICSVFNGTVHCLDLISFYACCQNASRGIVAEKKRCSGYNKTDLFSCKICSLSLCLHHFDMSEVNMARSDTRKRSFVLHK